MDLSLSDEAHAALRRLARSRDRAEADRARAVLLSAQGWTAPALGRSLGVRADTVRHWRTAYRQGGIEALRTHRSPGRPAHRGRRALEVLAAVLAEPLAPGAPPWTLPRLQHELAHRAGMHLSQPYLSRLLRKKGATHTGARATPSGAARTRRRSPRPART